MDVGAELKTKVGPLPLYGWLLIMTGLAAGAWLLLKKKSSSAAPTSGTPGTPCTQSDGSAGTWDSTGTVCQATTVLTVNSMAGTGGGRGWRGQSTTATGTGTAAGTAAASTPPATSSTTPPESAPVTGTGNPNAGNWSFPAPSVTVTGASKSSTQIVVHWTAVKGPGGQIPANYTVRIFRGGQQIRENAGVSGTSFTENGLSKGTTGLTVNVWANGGPLAPPHGTATT